MPAVVRLFLLFAFAVLDLCVRLYTEDLEEDALDDAFDASGKEFEHIWIAGMSLLRSTERTGPD